MRGYKISRGGVSEKVILQIKSVTPTTSAQQVTADAGYTALERVTVNAIPSAYKNTSDATATAARLRSGYIAYNANGKITGTLADYAGTTSVAPTKSAQTLSTNGRFVTSDITISAIPSNYVDTTDATATAARIRSNYTAYVNSTKITGSLADYTGPTSVTPSAIVQTLATGGKYVPSNITVAAVPETTFQAKTVTPTTSQQTVTADTGYTGLSTVTVNAIPSAYKNTSDATAVAGDIKSGKIAYNSSGKITGTLATYSGATSITPSKTAQTFSTSNRFLSTNLTVNPIPAEYFDTSDATAWEGAIRSGFTAYTAIGKITGTLASYSGALLITPTKSTQYFDTSGLYVMSNLEVAPIPANYIDTSDANATAARIRSGYTAYVNAVKITGTLADYTGATTVKSQFFTSQSLATAGKYVSSNIIVDAILVQSKTITLPYGTSTYITADSGYDCLAEVWVNQPAQYNITINGVDGPLFAKPTAFVGETVYVSSHVGTQPFNIVPAVTQTRVTHSGGGGIAVYSFVMPASNVYIER